MRLFRSWKYISIVTTAAVGSMIYYSMCVLWPNQVSSLYTSDLMNIGWLSLTVGAGTLLGQVVGGALCEPLGHQRWQMTIGCVGMTGFVGALAASSQTTKSMAIVLTLLGSFCVGWVEVVALVTAPLCHEQEDIGLAYGVSGTLKAGSGSIATSIYSTILSNKMATNIPKYVRPAALGAGLPLSSMPELLAAVASGEFSAVKGVNPHIISVVTEAYKTACSESFKIVYLASIAFGGLAIIAALWSPNMEHKLNDEVARRLHGKGIAENNLGHAELKNLGVEQLEVVHS